MIILSTKPIFKVAFHSSTSISNEKIGSFCTPKPVSITEVVWSHYTHIFWELGGLVALHSWTLRRWGGNEAWSRYTQVLIYLFIFLIHVIRSLMVNYTSGIEGQAAGSHWALYMLYMLSGLLWWLNTSHRRPAGSHWAFTCYQVSHGECTAGIEGQAAGSHWASYGSTAKVSRYYKWLQCQTCELIFGSEAARSHCTHYSVCIYNEMIESYCNIHMYIIPFVDRPYG